MVKQKNNNKGETKEILLTKQKRDVVLDLIRCIAIYLLISVHFFLNSGFYDVPVVGYKMYIMVLGRTISIMCVPLFLLLTGYLMSKKELSVKYYKGIARIIIIHIICTILNFLYSYFFKHTPISFKTVTLGIFSNFGYSWYVGLYMGLFCLIPFLNLIYNNLDSKNKKKILLFTMISLTSMPSIGNYFFKTLPDLFLGMYPITYYFIGAYIREYHKKWNKWKCLGLWCAVILLNTFFNILISYNKKFQWTALVDWGGIENILSASLFFAFVININMKNCGKTVATVLRKISEWSFGMYLLSWIFDQYAYPKLSAAISLTEDRYKYYFVMVGFVFIGSMVLSIAVNVLYKLIIKLCGFIWNIKRNKKSAG